MLLNEDTRKELWDVRTWYVRLVHNETIKIIMPHDITNVAMLVWLCFTGLVQYRDYTLLIKHVVFVKLTIFLLQEWYLTLLNIGYTSFILARTNLEERKMSIWTLMLRNININSVYIQHASDKKKR